MENSAECRIDSSSKNFSTSESRNSTKNVKNSNLQVDNQNLRLFTFMNCKQTPQQYDKIRKYKKSSLQQSTYQGQKLVQLIEHSRRKRQSYLTQIQKSCLNIFPEQKKQKTSRANNSTNIKKQNKNIKKKQHSLIKLTIPLGNKSPNKSSLTPQATSRKMFRAKSSLGHFKQSLTCDSPKANHQDIQKLIKKKQQLQKQLLNINSSLLMKKKKNNNSQMVKKKKHIL